MDSRQLLRRLLSGRLRNVAFADFERLALAMGFRQLRLRGSHRIYVHPAVEELLNLQSVRGEAKPYQIRQFLNLVERYDLVLEDDA